LPTALISTAIEKLEAYHKKKEMRGQSQPAEPKREDFDSMNSSLVLKSLVSFEYVLRLGPQKSFLT